VPEDSGFGRLVSLACHDLRTPLATIGGFARTVPRIAELNDQGQRFLDLIVSASQQMAELIDQLSLAARVESGLLTAEPEVVATDELARSAAATIGDAAEAGSGAAGTVWVNPEAAVRALAALGSAAVRHGGLERIVLRGEGDEVFLAPVTSRAAPVVTGTELRDLGAAVALRVIAAVGGSAELEADALVVRFPRARA
jgi:signal transduction histidine kinase